MSENPPSPVGAKAKNPFDVPSGRWKVYSVLTIIALAVALIGVVLGIDLLVMASLMASLFLAIGVVYSLMNEKGL